MSKLKTLYNKLLALNLKKAAEDIKELEQWDEPWHEEAVKEFRPKPEYIPRPEETLYADPHDEEFDKKDYDDFKNEYRRRMHRRNSKKDYTFLVENDIYPVSAEGKTLIGFGSSSVTYNAVYNGKPVVAKVSGEKKDITTWEDIFQNAPKGLIKYLPDIKFYKWDEQERRGIVVMEKLSPLPKSIEDEWNERFPHDYDQEEFEYEKQWVPKWALDIYNQLGELADNGIEWHDLHEGNIMIKPDTGQLKLMDVGLFAKV